MKIQIIYQEEKYKGLYLLELIKNSEILILDEATNALDSINENYIFSY